MATHVVSGIVSGEMRVGNNLPTVNKNLTYTSGGGVEGLRHIFSGSGGAP